MASVAASDLDPQLDALADSVIRSYETNDAEGYLRVFAPGAMVWLSYLNAEMSAEQNAALLTEIFRTFIAEFHYDNMRRQRTGTGYVQQFDLTIVAKSGDKFSCAAATVAQVNDEGLIVQLNEYLDSAMMAFSQEQMQKAGIEAPGM